MNDGKSFKGRRGDWKEKVKWVKLWFLKCLKYQAKSQKFAAKKPRATQSGPFWLQVWVAAARPTFTFLIHSLVYASAINMSTAQQELFAESIQSESSFKILKLKRNNYTEKISKNIYTEKLANAWATNLSTTEQEALAESIQSDTSKLHFDSMMTLPPAQMTKWTN